MESQLIENRHIRVFISSTFRDMQDERLPYEVYLPPFEETGGGKGCVAD